MMMLMGISMVRSGVKKSYGGLIANVLATKYGTLRAVTLGIGLAIAMQGATAVIVLASGLVGTGIISLATALAVAIGADVGSAIVLRILTFDISEFIPVLLVIGGWLHLKSQTAHRRHMGQIIFGIGLIILSLQLIKTAVNPLGTMPLFMDIAYYFKTDLLLAFMVGAVLTFAMHSSVASILTLVTLVHVGTLSVIPGVAFVLGANLGSGFIAYWITRNGEAEEILLPKTIMMLRGMMAVVCVLALVVMQNYSPMQGYLQALQEDHLIYIHLLFNVALLLWVPCIPFVINKVKSQNTPTDDTGGLLSIAQSCHCDGTTIHGFMCKEIIFILDILTNIVSKSEQSYLYYTESLLHDMEQSNTIIQQKVDEMKQFYAQVPKGVLSKTDARKIRDYIAYGVELGKASETLSGAFMALAQEKDRHKIVFSEKGWQEIKTMYEQLRQGILLIFDGIMGNKVEQNTAIEIQRQIVHEAYQKSLHRHLKRLNRGNTTTTYSSDLHLKTISNIYEIHNAILSLSVRDIVETSQTNFYAYKEPEALK